MGSGQQTIWALKPRLGYAFIGVFGQKVAIDKKADARRETVTVTKTFKIKRKPKEVEIPPIIQPSSLNLIKAIAQEAMEETIDEIRGNSASPEKEPVEV